MTDKNLLIVVGIGAIALILIEKLKSTKQPTTNSVLTAATTSPSGSASGILTPVLEGTSGLLSGFERLIAPNLAAEHTVSMIQNNVESNIASSGISVQEDTLPTTLTAEDYIND